MATRLVRLSDLDEHRVAKDHSDPRGWEVLSSEGRRVGKVVELLVDPDVLRARYLDVRVDEKELDMEPVDRHILLPVDQVRLRDGKKVEVDGLTRSDFRDYPVYSGLPLKEEEERRLRGFFGDGARRDTAERASDDRARRPGQETGREVESRDVVQSRDVAEGRTRDRTVRQADATDHVVRDPDAGEREPLDGRNRERRDVDRSVQDAGDRSRAGESATHLSEGEEVTVRVRDGEIVIEKGGRRDD